jgi:hypothetical protein
LRRKIDFIDIVDKGDNHIMITNKQTNKQTKLFVVSVLLNVFLLTIFIAGAYYKRDSIINRIKPLIEKQSNLEKNISIMNPEPYIGKKEYINVNNSDKNIDILVLGNSISLHGVVEGLWSHESGMAASKKDNDYVHILMRSISKNKNVGIYFEVVNIAEFERYFNEFDFKRLSIMQSAKPQYVIFQIGENISSNDIMNRSELFRNKYIELVNSFNNATKIICLPFWPNKEKNNIITDVAIQTNSYIVDLSHLGNGLDGNNFAKSENKYSNPGVAAHPGDYGMNNIALNLYSVFNALLPNEMK